MTREGPAGYQPIEDSAALDGNVVGGLLAARLGRDLTDEAGTCAHCGTTSAIGVLRAYAGPDWVLRCPACSGVVIRISVRRGEAIVDAGGLLGLSLAPPP